MVVVSPWAKRHHVSHAVYDHTSLLRLIELVFRLPALTDRDANADPLLDLFDFRAPALLTPPPLAASGHGGCRPRAWARR
jgi:phospholipase C